MYKLLADTVLVVHLAFVVFVVVGLVLIVSGGCLHWRWVQNRLFRFVHVAAIGVVVVQSWLGVACPLTGLEMWLRTQAGGSVYDGLFIQYWAQRLLYYDAPTWVFVTLYTLFGLLVVVAWLRFPPRVGRP